MDRKIKKTRSKLKIFILIVFITISLTVTCMMFRLFLKLILVNSMMTVYNTIHGTRNKHFLIETLDQQDEKSKDQNTNN